MSVTVSGRSRSASLVPRVKGGIARAAGMSHVAPLRPSLKLPGMLDEPVGSLPLLGLVSCLLQVRSMEAEALCVEVVRF